MIIDHNIVFCPDPPKTSEGVDKYIGHLRLAGVDVDGRIDESLPLKGEQVALLFDCADGQAVYQIMSLPHIDDKARNYVWAKLDMLMQTVEVKRKRFYGKDGRLL